VPGRDVADVQALRLECEYQKGGVALPKFVVPLGPAAPTRRNEAAALTPPHERNSHDARRSRELLERLQRLDCLACRRRS